METTLANSALLDAKTVPEVRDILLRRLNYDAGNARMNASNAETVLGQNYWLIREALLREIAGWLA